MPTNDSNLTNTYIANTYQKLLQVDSQHNGLGYITFGYNELVNALNGDSATLLNGLGQRQAALVVDHNTTGNGGGIFVKNDAQYTGGMWGMQVVNSGLNFWTVGVGGDNYRLFLKNTGTVWIGYSDYSVPGTDESGYNLYVKGLIGYDKVRITANPNDIPISRLVVPSISSNNTNMFDSKSYSAISGTNEYGTYLKWGPRSNSSPEQNRWRKIATSVDYDRFISARMLMTGSGGQAVWNGFIFYFSVDATEGGDITTWLNGTIVSAISGKFSNKSDWNSDLDRLSDYNSNISSTSFFVPANKDIYGAFPSPFKNDDGVNTEVYLTMIETKLGV